MKKEALILILLSVLVIFSSYAYAVGGSTNYGSTTNQTASCNDKATARERIECRLKANSADPAGVDESCRVLNGTKKDNCVALYQASQRCYEMTNKDKTSCFRNVVGLTNQAFNEQRDNQDAIRNYLVLVLYEAQERAEDRVKAGEITTEEGARVIALIVETKQAILKGESQQVIKSKILELRRVWNEVMP